MGLLVKRCERALKALGKGAPRLGRLRHEFLWINGTTYGFTLKNDNDFPIGPGRVAINDDWDINNTQHDGWCYEVKCVDEQKLEANTLADHANPPHYNFFGYNCRAWVSDQINKAKKKECCDK